MQTTALKYLKRNWDQSLVGSSDASALLNVRPATLKTRVARGQAKVLRDECDRERAALSFTAHHLIYNLIQDRMLQYGLPLEGADGKDFAAEGAQWVYENILSGAGHVNAAFRYWKREGGLVLHIFEDGNIQQWTGDACMIIPIGTMTVRLAVKLFVRTPEGQEFMSGAREFFTDKNIPIHHLEK